MSRTVSPCVRFEGAGDHFVICGCALLALLAASEETKARAFLQVPADNVSPIFMHWFTTDTHWRAFAGDTTCSWAAQQLISVTLFLYWDLWGKTTVTWELTLAFSCFLANKLGIFPRASALQQFRLQRAFSVSDLKRAQGGPRIPRVPF